MGPNLARILNNYWYRQRIFSKAVMCLGTAFGTEREVTQGNLASSMIFNILVDAVVQDVLEVECSPQEAQHGMG